jgi:glycosyltransferase involved in cell wall biosynthesis
MVAAVSQAPAPGTSRKSAPQGPLVLHLAARLDHRPEARLICDLAVLTQRRGHRAALASAGGPLVIEAERAAVRHMYLPSAALATRPGWFAGWQTNVMLQNYAQRERVALLHVHDLALLPLAGRLAEARHLPVLLDITEPVTVTKAARRWLQHPALAKACIRVPSTYMADYVRNRLQLTQPGLYRIAPGLDAQRFAPARVSPERLHRLAQQWRLPEQASVILTATPLAPNQGHAALLQAVAQLKRPDLFVVMVGDDSGSGFRTVIERQIKEHGLEGRVVMPNDCPDWAAACWLAELVVALNTAPRGQALELLTAQALGRTMIVTDCGANPEMAHSGQTAWLVAPDHAPQLQEALAEAVVMTAAQRVELGHRARDFVRAMYNQDDWVHGMLELYSAMLHRPMTAYGARQAS